MENADFSSIRIKPELRATQVEEAREMVPALTIYFDEKYDLGTTELSPAFQKMGLFQSLVFLAVHRGVILEVPEPLWIRFLPKTVILAGVWKTSGLVARRPRVVVTYAIENNELKNLIAPRQALPAVAVRGASWLLGSVISLLIDRIAYGSAASKSSYRALPGVARLKSEIIEELPVRGAGVVAGEKAHAARALFVGELATRKGLSELLHAWEHVEDSVAGAHLTIVGSGPLRSETENWAKIKPASRSFSGFVQHRDLPPIMASATVLIAPSIRDGRWREQIGLPIAEGLSAGLTVVTTDETGLATWLRNNGHTVLPVASVSKNLAGGIIAALTSPLDRADVTESLPRVAGRIASDKWLHSQDA